MIATVVAGFAGSGTPLAWGGRPGPVHSGPRLPADELAGLLTRWSHAGVGLGLAALALTLAVRVLVARAEHRHRRRPVRRKTPATGWARRRAARHLLATLASLAPGSWGGRAPVLLSTSPTPVGMTLRVALPAGASPGELPALAERLAVAADLAAVRLGRDADRAGVVELALLERDPFAGEPPSWPWAKRSRAEVSAGLPLGVDEAGEVVALSLLGHHLLLGGEPGAGKSTALATLLAGAVLDPCCRLHLLDGKGVDLPRWAPVATGYAGAAPEAALAVLSAVVEVMDARFAVLAERGVAGVAPGDGLGAELVVIDELAHYLTIGTKAERESIAGALRDLVARGRAAGVVVVAATQKPGSDAPRLHPGYGRRAPRSSARPPAADRPLGPHLGARLRAARRGGVPPAPRAGGRRLGGPGR